MAFDNFKVGYDNNSDGDIDDAGDDIQIDDSFASNAFSLTYDNNGNLTDDGILLFGYDAWNRLVKATRRLDALTTVATYGYDGMNRRTQKAVSNCGAEVRVGDGGNTTVHFYYDSQWRILETRNGSNQTTRQWVFGTQYVDEVLFMDVNGDPTASNDANIDVSTNGEGSESPADHRYFYQQDRNWNVVALTDYVAGGGGNNGAIVERYVYTSYGEPLVLKGVGGGTSELANTSLSSLVGNPLMWQGLVYDAEEGNYQNRQRSLSIGLSRYQQYDPLGDYAALTEETLGALEWARLPALGSVYLMAYRRNERQMRHDVQDVTNSYSSRDSNPNMYLDAVGLEAQWIECPVKKPPTNQATQPASYVFRIRNCISLVPPIDYATTICCAGKCGAYIPDGFPGLSDLVTECVARHECTHCSQWAAGRCWSNRPRKCDDPQDDGRYPDGSLPPTGEDGEPQWQCECEANTQQFKCIDQNCRGHETPECAYWKCRYRKCEHEYYCRRRLTKEEYRACVNRCASEYLR